MSPFPLPAGRMQYESSGGVHVLLFVASLLLTCVVALVMSAVLYLFGTYVIHLVVIVPAIAAIPVGLAWMGGVRLSHCRNRWLAIGGGVLAGSLFFLGSYYVSLTMAINQPIADIKEIPSPTLLPTWIHFNMQLQEVGNVGQGKNDNKAPEISNFKTGLNYFLFAVECAVAIGIVAGMGGLQAAKAYSESRERWMSSVELKTAAGASQWLAEAMAGNQVAEQSARIAEPLDESQGYCELTFEVCPKQLGDELARGEESVWVSATEYGPAAKKGERKSVKTICQWELRPAEYATLQAHQATLPSLNPTASTAV